MPISITQQQPYILIVSKVLSAKQQNTKTDTSKEERQIDIMVYHLYSLTYDEAKLIDTQLTQEEFSKYKK